MQFLSAILILLFLPILATTMTNDKVEKDPQHHQNIQNLEEEKIVEKSAEGILAKIHRFVGHLGTDPGRGKEILKDLCALRTAQNSKDLNEDESKGIFKIDSKHQIRIKNGQINAQLNEEINMKLDEICSPKASKKLIEELPKYITRIIEERKGAISGHFEQVKIVYYENGEAIKTLGLKEIMAKGMLKAPFSQVFEQLRQILLSTENEIGDENEDNILKQIITKLITEKWPPMPSELWKICTDLWEDYSNHLDGELAPQKVGETNKAKNAMINKNKSFPPPHPYQPMKGIAAHGRRKKRALSAQQREHLRNVIVSVVIIYLVLMPYIFSIGAAASSSFQLLVSMSLWPFLALPRFFGRLMATGNNLVFLMFIAFNMYAFHQYGSFPSSPDQGGIISTSSLEMGMQMEPEKAEKAMERLGGN